MPHREVTLNITDVVSSVTDGTINMIQSANESVKKQLINRYCGRLSTWETSWFGTLKEGQIILEAHEVHGHSLFPAPMVSALSSVPDKSADSTSDRNNRSVSAINKVLERYNLVRKRRLN